jgi:hypothetical protein
MQSFATAQDDQWIEIVKMSPNETSVGVSEGPELKRPGRSSGVFPGTETSSEAMRMSAKQIGCKSSPNLHG